MDNDPVSTSSAALQASSVAIRLRLQQQVAATALTREAVQEPVEISSAGQSSYDRVLDVSA